MADRTTLRILVSGASIAGNTLAWWLGRRGHDVTVVERAPAFRDGGQNVDVRGAAQTVLRQMGLFKGTAALGTGEAGIRFVDEHDETIAEFLLAELGGKGLTSDLEILRGDLARLIFEDARDRARYVFDDAIASVDDQSQRAVVTFASGTQAEYDLVLIAEGAGSRTREMLFKGENRPRDLNLTMAYFVIPKTTSDGPIARWFTAGRGRSVLLRPDRMGTTRAVLSLETGMETLGSIRSTDPQSLMMTRFAGAGWETARVLEGMQQSAEFYSETLRQIRMERWSHGRVGLVGDAAWCATPLSGMGTSLAILGGYVLAGELTAADNVAAAFANYETVMRPIVDRAQAVPSFAPRLAQPRSRLGVSVQRLALRLVAIPALSRIAGKLFVPKASKFTLPEYPFDEV